MILELVVWGGAALLVYTYFGYPALVSLWAKADPTGNYPQPRVQPPKVTVVIPAHNEASVIAKKIENTRALVYEGSLEIVVASDGSTDGTNEIVREALAAGGLFIQGEPRRGKTAIVNDSAAAASGEILLFTDANVMLAADAVACIVRPFEDLSVGCVQGQLNYTNEGESENAANGGLYWRYEEAIKRAESETGSLMGADGSIFAVRRRLFRPLPEHVLDDFCTSMGVIAQGGRIVFAPDAKAYERATVHSSEEFRRKIRIANRSMTSFLHIAPQLRAMGARNWFKLVSHKMLRWASGFVMLAVLAANLGLAARAPQGLYGWTLAAQIVFYGAAALALRGGSGRLVRALSIPGYFLITVAATTVGVARGLAGTRVPFWTQMGTTR